MRFEIAREGRKLTRSAVMCPSGERYIRGWPRCAHGCLLRASNVACPPSIELLSGFCRFVRTRRALVPRRARAQRTDAARARSNAVLAAFWPPVDVAGSKSVATSGEPRRLRRGKRARGTRTTTRPSPRSSPPPARLAPLAAQCGTAAL
jgi:hypothetical protein